MKSAPTDNLRPIATFKPYPWQVKAWRDTSFVLLATGSAGGGKSRFCAEKLHGFLKRYPGAMGLMLRKTRESMTNSTTLFMQTEIIDADPNVTHKPSKNRFEYANGSILAYGGMKDDSQREQVRSIGLRGGVDICWMEEATRFTENDFNELLARMRGKAAPWRQILLSTNPDAPTHWIHKRLMQAQEASVYYSSALDNPANPPEYRDALNALTGVLGLRLRDGKWAQAEGAVYEDFDPQVHVIDPFDIPKNWRRVRAVDFGFTNPFVCQWWAIDGDGRAYLYREIYRTQTLVEDHAKRIRELSTGETIEATVADHDAEDRATLHRHGVQTLKAKKDFSPGVQEVQSRLRKAGDGKPRLFLLRGALVETDKALASARKPVCTEDEFPAYVWAEGASGPKEVAVKENDHGMDAMRYLCMYLRGGQTRQWTNVRGI